MPDDFNAQLASHETIIRHLTALIVKMDTAIHALKEGQALIIQLLHRCDVPLCVNAESHLFLGTHKENMRDRDNKGRGWWQKR